MKDYCANNHILKNGHYQAYREQSAHTQEQQATQEQRISNIITQAQSFFKNQNYEAAIIKLKLASEKINYLKQNKRQYDKRIELVCLYNLAATYQKQWNLNECIPLLQKFCTLLRSLLQDNLKSSGMLNQADFQNKHWFKMKALQIKSELQYCAVLSQIGEHKKALKIAIDLTAQMRILFKKSCEECGKFISKRQSQMAKSKINGEMKSSKIGVNDKIQFSLNVLINANKTLQQLSDISTYTELFESIQVQKQMKQVKQKLYYWKNNPQNNIKMIRQSFNSEKVEMSAESKTSSHRNLLGIKRTHNSWIQQFTISKVMFMTYINYVELCDVDNLIFEFNQRNILEKIIYLSVSYFSLSIELRFLEQEQNQKNFSKEDIHLSKKNKQKDSKQNKNLLYPPQPEVQQEKPLKKSEIFHLKSIQIFCKYIKQNSPFVNHLVLNYHKHYKNNLNTIQQQNSMAEYSVLYDAINPAQQSSKKVLRSESVYFEQIIPEPNPSQEEISIKLQKFVTSISSFKKILKKKSQEELEEESSKQSKSNSYNNDKCKFLFSSTQFLGQLQQKDKTLKKVNSNTKMVTLKLHQVNQLVDKSQKEQSSRNQSNSKYREKNSLSKSKQFLKNSVTLKQNKKESPTKQKLHKPKLVSNLKESQQLSRQQRSIKKSTSHHALDLLKKSGSLHELKLKQSARQFGNVGNGMKKK